MEEQAKDYEFVNIGNKRIKTPHLIFAFGVILLILLFLFGSISDDIDTQMVIIWVSVFAIAVSILWGVRKRIFSIIASFLILVAIYYISGCAVDMLGLGEPYSYGLMTFLLISVFVFWVSLDSSVSWGDAGKVMLFVIIMYAMNVSGWLPEVNDMIATYFGSGLPI